MRHFYEVDFISLNSIINYIYTQNKVQKYFSDIQVQTMLQTVHADYRYRHL